MRFINHQFTSPAIPIARLLLAFVLCTGLLPVQAIASPEADDIVVVAVKGDVQFTMGGTPHAVRAGSTLELPAAIRTGDDGSVDLRQGESTIGIGPDTQLDLPAPAQRGDLIDRVVQPLGNAFYNVSPRESRRLRVETPYLVAVIKGTQFNVAVEPDSSTISLFEGRLEVLAPDINAAVELNAGEVAIRHSGDEEIRVLQLKDRAAPSAESKGDGGAAATTGLTGSGTADQSPQVPHAPSPLDNEVEILIDGTNPGTAVNVNAVIDDAVGAQVSVDAGIDLGAGSIDAGVDAGLLGTDVGVDIGADLSGGDAGLDIGLDVLGTEIDLGLGGDSTTGDSDAGSGTDGSGGLLDGILRPRGQ